MFVTLGDLVEDVVIRVEDPINVASDTEATIERRRGGSAANVAAMAARLGHPSRFLGKVGGDAIGDVLVADLAADGVDVSHVRQGGRSGTIVVLVDPDGERTMLTDRGACRELDRPSERWLDGAETLHVPMYSFVGEPLASTTGTVIGWAREHDVAVSIDVSSVALIASIGAGEVRSRLDLLRPSVVFANEHEAAALGVTGPIAGAITVVKRGPAPAVVFHDERRVDVPTAPIRRGADTTGAGDAFAAGFLHGGWRMDPAAACRSGHRAAALVLRGHRG